MMGDIDEERGERIPAGLIAEDQALESLLTNTYSKLRPSVLSQLAQLGLEETSAVLAKVDTFCMNEAKEIVGKMVKAATESGAKGVVKKGDVGGVKGTMVSDADGKKGFADRLLAMADELLADPANSVAPEKAEDDDEMKDEDEMKEEK